MPGFNMIDLSIIIVSYNTKKLTLDCIDSILKEGSKLKVEIIVVDNGSKDGSVEELRKVWRKNRNVLLIENKENLGFSKANNQGIRVATGKQILLLNSDTIVKRNSLLALFNFAEKTKDAGVVGSRLLNPDKTVQPSCLNFPTIKNAILEYWFGKKGLFEKYAPKGKRPTEVDAVVGTAFLITTRSLKEVGLLNEKYFFYFEDIDYCRRVWGSGLKVYYLPESEIIHYHGASGRKIADEKNQWRRLVPGSKIYHGLLKHYILFIIMWLSQKWQKILTKQK